MNPTPQPLRACLKLIRARSAERGKDYMPYVFLSCGRNLPTPSGPQESGMCAQIGYLSSLVPFLCAARVNSLSLSSRPPTLQAAEFASVFCSAEIHTN